MQMNRRDVMKGISLSAGGLVLAPVLNQIQAQATGEKQTRKRFVFVVESNGVPPDQMAPSGIKRKRRHQRPLNGPEELIDVSLKERELPVSLQPIKKWKDRVTIVNGLSGRICGGGHSNNFGALGCFPTPKESKSITDETIDGALAKTIPGIFPHIGLGISKRLEHSVIYNISSLGPNKGLPTMCKPDQAYSALFGSVAEGKGKAEFNAKNNLLDFLKEDIKSVEKKLAGPEREQLSAYLATFETLRDRQSKLNEIEQTLRKQGPVPSDKYTSKVETDRLDAQFDIGAAALICGLTNVLTLSSAAGIRDFDICFTGLGLKKGKHHTGHGGSQNGMTWFEVYNMIRRYHFDLIAGFMKKLESVKEGDGTMLDNTVIVYLSDGAEGHHSRCWEWPMVVIGNIDNKLKPGRDLDYPCYGRKNQRTTANLYTTLLHLAGSKRDSFGSRDPMLKDIDQSGPLQEMFA